MKFAYNCPRHSRQRLARRERSGCLKMPDTLRRAPQCSGGVASSRMEWVRCWLRKTQSTPVKANGGTSRISSVQVTVPRRITSSGWLKIQSAPALSALSAAGRGKPAIQIRPSLVRRTSSSGRSMVSCSKPKPSMERAESAASTEGNLSASRPCTSSRRTFSSSSEGIRPFDRAAMASMRTVTPSNRDTCCSSTGRNSSIRGTMTKCNAPQTMTKAIQADATNQNAARMANAPARRMEKVLGVKSVIFIGAPCQEL